MPRSPFADLTAAQYDLLLAVARQDDPSTMDVIQAYRTARGTSSTPNDMLDQLNRRGYVDVADGSLRLSEKGRGALWTFRDELSAAIEASVDE